ncbi:2-oxo-4-hydroxy-4-carboxy-5-ureidoimidazoline decarboxylase [Marisediminicola sp. UYEF4]|uniref:2-oxo-4-hydroxy-4-carboxy-5-ureidoimidazoline decarboxylase n=1 Tax=Marisediminicola sp. UYEF4 TaxID=1756384 RepID=UPI003390BC9A
MRELNDAELRDGLTAALAVRRWVDEVASHAPFANLDALFDAARVAAPLRRSEIDEALGHHPRIGEKPVGEGAAQQFSRAEQASADAGDSALAAAVADGNRRYEQRFDRVFLIRAAGRSRAEILAELERRLLLDDRTELAIVSAQLIEIALLRLEKTFGPTFGGEPS